jgi:DNA-binding CsgD family transcriptional regulator
LLLAGRARLLIDVNAPAALAALREALALARGLDDPLAISFVPWLAAVLLAERLPAAQVARLSGGVATLVARSAAIGGRQLIDVFGAPSDQVALAQAVAAARATLDEAAFAAADTAGRALSPDEFVDELLDTLEQGEVLLAPSDQSRQRDNLISPREREVLALVAEGRSNQEIAEVLFIAHSTVKSHVAALLTKLDADNRAQLATIAAHRGLLAG